MISANGIMTIEATEELNKFFEKPLSMVNPDGNLVAGANTDLISWTFYNMTRRKDAEIIIPNKYKPSKNNMPILNKLDELNLPKFRTILFGDALAEYLGYLPYSNTLTLIVEKHIFELLIKDNINYNYDVKKNKLFNKNFNINISNGYGDFTFEEMENTALYIKEFLFPSFNYLIKYATQTKSKTLSIYEDLQNGIKE